jgi:hypothetical protein
MEESEEKQIGGNDEEDQEFFKNDDHAKSTRVDLDSMEQKINNFNQKFFDYKNFKEKEKEPVIPINKVVTDTNWLKKDNKSKPKQDSSDSLSLEEEEVEEVVNTRSFNKKPEFLTFSKKTAKPVKPTKPIDDTFKDSIILFN